MYMIDATFTKISKIWVQFVIKMTLKSLCFVRKIMHRKKMSIFLLQLLSLPVLEIVCFLERKKKEEYFCFSIFYFANHRNVWQTNHRMCVSGASLHEDNGLHLLLPASEEDQRKKHRRKSFVNFKMPPKRLIFLIS